MCLNGEAGLSYDNVRIYFEDLSEEAKATALQHQCVENPSQANWDVFELAIVAEGTKEEMTQRDIDLAALTNIGVYAA